MSENLISVIIPVYNGEVFLADLINSIKKQKLHSKFYEVIFIDNGSTDNSSKILKEFTNTSKNIRYLYYDSMASSYAARNYGVKNSQGSILAFTDCDCVLDESYLSNIHDIFINQNYDGIIAGNISIKVIDNNNMWEVFDRFSSLNNERMVRNGTAATANVAVKKKVFLEIGFFKEVVSGGDSEWTNRAVRNNYELSYFHSVSVDHPSRKTKEEIEKKVLRIAFGEGQRKKIANKKYIIWLFMYFLKSFNIRTLIRIYNSIIQDLGFCKTIIFLCNFTFLRFRCIRSFSNGFRSI